MPNWCTNTIAIKGSNENLLKFINQALINSGINKPADNIETGFKMLNSNLPKHKSVDEKDQIKLFPGLTLRSWYPMPDIFLEYDTTNRHDLKEIEKQQLKEYGCIGWYNYNLSTLGCKWDCDVNDLKMITDNNGNNIIMFYCDSPWCTPEEWIKSVREDFDLSVYARAEEGGMGIYSIDDDGYYEYYDPEDYYSIEDRLYLKEHDYDDHCQEIYDDVYEKLEEIMDDDFNNLIMG